MNATKKQLGISKPPKRTGILVTVAVIALAIVLVWIAFSRYETHPWTRDGQIRADIIGITAYVSGKVVRIAVRDAELVKANVLLFEIDPSSYEIALENAKVSLDEARQQVAALEAAVTSADAAVQGAQAGITKAKATIVQSKANLKEATQEAQRAARLVKASADSVEHAQQTVARKVASRAQLDVAMSNLVLAEAQLASAIAAKQQAKATLGHPGEDNFRIRTAKVAVSDAELNLKRTKVYAPSEGWVTNLYLRPGDYVTPGEAMMVFVDKESLRVAGFFKETQLAHIKPGDQAVITLMGLSDRPIKGIVENIGRAIKPTGNRDD